MNSRTASFVLLIVLLVVPLSGHVFANVAPYTADLTPAERHQILADTKVKAAERRVSIAAPASVMDVSGYDATYYEINVKIDEVLKWVWGEVTMHAQGRVDGYDSPTLNLEASMTVDSVKQAGQSVAWSRGGNYLYVTLNAPVNTGEDFDITVWYQGSPTTGGLMGFSFSEYGGSPVISTLSEPYMAQSWWPCKDTPSDKADSADMNITVNSSFYAVSNGDLRDSVGNGDGTTTYFWHEGYPITTYLISLAITDYTVFDDWYHHVTDADSTLVRFFSYPSRASLAQASWPVAVDQMEFFSETWGEYPFNNEKYGMAHFNWGGAMEHQTVTSATYGSFGFDQYLIAHELAHQWWGDMITCQDWHHIWLNEGFASYSEALWAEHQYGSASYRSYMGGMAYYSGGRIYIDDTTNVNNIFSTRVYDKGAWVLHMLRGVVGDADFFEILRQYYNSPHQHSDAVTEDFQAICESVSGMDLNAFFQDWIYGYYYPHYMWSWTTVPHENTNFYDVYVHIRQYQTTTPQAFTMPIQLQFNGVGGTPVYTIWNDQREQDFVILSPGVPTSITFDPMDWILCTEGSETYGLHVITPDLADATEWLAYSDTVVAIGGSTPHHYQLISGALPGGLNLDEATGEIAGTPTASGDFTFTVDAWDNGYLIHDQQEYTITVAGLGYRPGDLDGSLTLDAVDLNDLIDYLFFNGTFVAPENAADLNGDCVGDAIDLNAMIDVLFFNAPDPVPGCIQ